MRYAFSNFIINPLHPVKQAGHIQQVEKIDKVHDDLLGRIIAFDDGKQIFINICVDLLSLAYRYTEEMNEFAGRYFDKPAHIVLSATHTHYGGDSTDDQYHDQLISQFKKAIEDLQFMEGNLYYTYKSVPYEGVGTSRITNHKALVLLNLLQFFDEDEREVLDIINYNCHPTVLSAVETDYFSAEYCGYALNRLSENSDTFFDFLQGAAGDVSTRFTRSGQHYEDVIELGEKFVAAIEDLRNDPAELHDFISLEFEQQFIPISYDFSPIDTSLMPDNLTEREKETIGYGAIMRQRLMDNPEKLQKDMLISRVGLGDVSLIFSPNELFSYYLKQVNTKKAILNCYSNGYSPYIPPLDEILFTYETFYDVLSRDTKEKLVEVLKEYSNR